MAAAQRVISVPPQFVEAVTEALAGGLDRPGVGDELGEILGVGLASFGVCVFRTTNRVDDTIPDTGEWHDRQTEDLPNWLAPFNGPRLVARDEDGSVLASVGIKVHDKFGRELTVPCRRISTHRTTTRAHAWLRRSGSSTRVGPCTASGRAHDRPGLTVSCEWRGR